MTSTLCTVYDSNRNSVGELVRVSGNWFADELPYAFPPRDVGRYQAHLLNYVLLIVLVIVLINWLLTNFCVIPVQRVKGSSQTLEYCTFGT